ncbi:peptidylprolyl isomerase [Nitrospina watsonii]|nr:peptidylprolyl isomerase [Nitrospina watsonii]
MKHWKPYIKSISLAALLLLSGWVPFANAEVLDRVVAKVNNEIITLSALEERARVDLARFQSMGVENIPTLEEVRSRALDQMIDEILLVDVASKVGLIVEESQMQDALDDVRQRGNLSEKQLEEMLKQEGRSLEEYKKRIREQILMSKVINLEVRSRIKVSDKEIAEFYDEHRKEFWTTAQVRARHILFIMDQSLDSDQIATKERKAREALAKIRNGADFAEVAQEFSEDVTASNGGDLGVLEKGKMIPEFEKAAFALKNGEVSSIVRSPYGLHIIKVDEVLPGAPIPMEDVENQIIAQLKQQSFRTYFEEYIEDLHARSFIEKKLGPVEPEQKTQTVAVETPQTMAVNEVESIQEKPQAEILPPFEIGKKMDSPKPAPVADEYEPLEKKLKYYKNLRDMNLISEQEYNQHKKSLLDNL